MRGVSFIASMDTTFAACPFGQPHATQKITLRLFDVKWTVVPRQTKRTREELMP